MSQPLPDEQMTLEELHACPACEGAGKRYDHELEQYVPCRACQGSGMVAYDPDDRSIPFG